MWPRVVEAMLGTWLVLSPLVFAETLDYSRFQTVDVTTGAAVVGLSLASFWRRDEWLHLVTAVVAVALALLAYFGSARPGPPGAQNEIVTALLLLLFAIIPNEANRPPKPWRGGA